METATTTVPNSFVMIDVASTTYAVHCSWTAELLSNFETLPIAVPGTDKSLVGVVNHRGSVIPVFDLRAILGLNSYQSEVAAMENFIKEREQDHVSWLEALRHTAETGNTFSKAIDPKLCAFGKWYESLKKNPQKLLEVTGGSTVLNQLFNAFDAPHRRIHGIAKHVIDLCKAGELGQAHTIIQQTWDTDLAVMRNLFKAFIEQFTQTFQPMALILVVDGTKFAILVDDISSVIKIEEDEFRALPELVSTTNVTLGTQEANVGQKLIVRFDADRLVKLARQSAESLLVAS